MAKPKAKTSAAQLSREDKLKILKRAKVYSGSTKIEKGKATGAQKRALAKFRADIPLLQSGMAKSVDISKVKRGAKPTLFAHTSKRIIVPVANKAERVHVNKKTGALTSVFKTPHGTKFRQKFFEPTFELSELPRVKGASYQITFNQSGTSYKTFSYKDPEQSIQELAAFMFPYQVREKNPWTDWVLYVSILEKVK